MQRSAKAGHSTGGLLTVMAEYWHRSLISHKMDIDVSAAPVHALAGHLAGAAADASGNVNVNRHLIPHLNS
jgi:hypothetical protein